MSILRALAAAAISFLLLQPLLRLIVTQQKAPKVLSFIDQSNSVQSQHDSLQLMALSEQLKAHFGESQGGKTAIDYKEFYFGDQVSGDAKESGQLTTDMSKIFELVYQEYANENIAGVVIASDGLYNIGANPLYLNHTAGIPVHTIGLGDTTIRRDLSVKNVLHNSIAYKGDKMSIEIDVAASNAMGLRSNLLVYKVVEGKSERIHSEPVVIDRKDYFNTYSVILDLDDAGVQQYRIALSAVDNEVTRSNNARDIFIRVIETRRRIALIARNPHPDLTALKQLLSANDNYELELHYAKDKIADLAKYDLAILHQLPSSGVDKTLVQRIKDQKIPMMIIVGKRSSTKDLNDLQNLVTIDGGNRRSNEVQGSFDGSFTLFEVEDEWKSLLAKYPPLLAPFGKSRVSGEARVMLKQQIGSVKTDYPLVVYGEESDIRMMIIQAEGLWRWKLFHYLDQENFEGLEIFMEKSIQYLSSKEDKRKFRATSPKYVFDENESITLGTELYNSSYDAVNDPEVQLQLRNSEGEIFDYVMDRTELAYRLDLSGLAPGNYRFSVSTRYEGEELRDAGRFVVKEVQLESVVSTADHNLLRELSAMTEGQFLAYEQLPDLGALIGLETMKPTMYQSSQTRSLMELRWLFFLLVIPLLLEWFLRRYHGSY